MMPVCVFISRSRFITDSSHWIGPGLTRPRHDKRIGAPSLPELIQYLGSLALQRMAGPDIRGSGVCAFVLPFPRH
jgi:hypothetical protein